MEDFLKLLVEFRITVSRASSFSGCLLKISNVGQVGRNPTVYIFISKIMATMISQFFFSNYIVMRAFSLEFKRIACFCHLFCSYYHLLTYLERCYNKGFNFYHHTPNQLINIPKYRTPANIHPIANVKNLQIIISVQQLPVYHMFDDF